MLDKHVTHYTLGIDLGTQSIKALVLDIKTKATCGTFSVPLDITQDGNGLAEQNAVDWINAFIEVVKQVPEHYLNNVRSMAVSGQQHGLVVLNKEGDVIAPVKLWCDTTSSEQCLDIMQALGGQEECIRLVGNPMMPGYTAPKLKQLKDNAPDIFQAMRTVLLPHDYLNFWLTGERCMEMGDASGTGLLDVSKREWSNALINAIDDSGHLASCLPSLSLENRSIGTLIPDVAQRLGLSNDVQVAIGGGDNMMAAIGTNTTNLGRMTLSLGTSGTIFAFSEHAIDNSNGELANFCSSNGGWLPLVCTMACTTTTESVRHLLGYDVEEIDASLKLSPVGAEGLSMLAYLNGERVPNLPNSEGVLAGINSQNLTQTNLIRASVEGVTFGLYYGFNELQAHNINPTQITLTGGGANSPQWCQMVADLFGVKTSVYKNNEGAAFGAALQACSLVDNHGIIDATYTDSALANYDQIEYTPNPSLVEAYQSIYQNYLNLQRHMRPFFS